MNLHHARMLLFHSRINLMLLEPTVLFCLCRLVALQEANLNAAVLVRIVRLNSTVHTPTPSDVMNSSVPCLFVFKLTRDYKMKRQLFIRCRCLSPLCLFSGFLLSLPNSSLFLLPS